MNKKIWQPINLADMFFTSAELNAEKEALHYKVGHHYHTLSYFELRKEVFGLAEALRLLGFEKGDRAILISENRPEWVITDLALQTIGAINVPIHEVLSSHQLAGILVEIKPKAIFYADKKIEDKLLEISEEIGKIDYLISFTHLEDKGFDKMLYLKNLIEKTELSEVIEANIIENALKIRPDDLASIIYTSGTTGHLKGVQLTHGNFVANITGTVKSIWVLPSDKFFSVLPLSHVFERTAGYYIPIYAGASIGYCLSLETLSAEIQESKPTIVLAVPRLYEKIYEKVQTKANKNLVTKLIFKIAFSINTKKKNSLLYKIFDHIVFSKIKGNFGGNIRFFISGGASLPKKIGQFFAKVDMLVLEGYGLTETSPIIAVNEIERNKFGTVGHVLENLEVKLDKDGEILVKGPSITVGYLWEEDNKTSFTKDGYFKTGDLGSIDKEGFLSIIGRKKDIIVLTTGKKVAPVSIENALESSLFIEQAMVIGDGYKHISALIVPNFEKLEEKFGISGKSKLIKDEAVNELIKSECERLTSKFASIDQVKKFVLLSEPFSIANGEMTPKLSLRRHVILENNKEVIEALY